jgi:hypothetical protein
MLYLVFVGEFKVNNISQNIDDLNIIKKTGE